MDTVEYDQTINSQKGEYEEDKHEVDSTTVNAKVVSIITFIRVTMRMMVEVTKSINFVH